MTSGSARGDFLAQVEWLAKSLGLFASVVPLPDVFAVNLFIAGETDPAILYLENIFLETRALDPHRCAEHIRRMLKEMGTVRPGRAGIDAVRPKLVPVLRAQSFVRNADKMLQEKHPTATTLATPFVPFLLECVAVDSDAAIHYATSRDAAQWNVPHAELLKSARDNLAPRATDGLSRIENAPFPAFSVRSRDSYEISRVLLPGWLAGMSQAVGGPPICAMPERSTLVITTLTDPRAVGWLAGLAVTEYVKAPRRVTPALYTVDAYARVIPLVLPPEHPFAQDVARAHAELARAES